MKIKGFNLPQLHNAEFIQFHRQILNRATTELINAINATNQKQALTEKLDQLEELHRKSTANARTQIIEELDAARDRAIIGISNVVEGYLNHHEPATVQAAELLFKSLKIYGMGGSIARQNYNAETASLISILKDWKEQADLVAAVQSLNLGAWLNHLEEQNTAFEAEYAQRTEEYAEANPQTLRDVRLETHSVYYAFRDYVEANAVLNPSEELSAFINFWNAQIEQYNTLIANRQKDPDSPQTEPEEEE